MNHAPRVLLVNPPVTRPCEPPAGLARLAGSLRQAGFSVTAWDANLEGLLNLLNSSPEGSDTPHPGTWTKRAARDLPKHLAEIRSGEAFRHFDTYSRVIGDLERLLARHPSHRTGWHLSLTDCTNDSLRPTRSVDLAKAAREPEINPFFNWFSGEWKQKFESGSFDLIGISVSYLSQALTAAMMAGFLRTQNPKALIVLGGGLITSWLSRPGFKNPWPGIVDDLVGGPGEEPVQKLLRDLAPEVNKKAEPAVMLYPKAFGGKPGKTYDFSGFSFEQYLSPGLVLPVSLSHGCYWHNCSFCPENVEKAGFHPLSDMISLLQCLAKSYRPRMFHLLDNALSPGFLQQAARHEIGAPWFGFARLEEPLDDPDFCHSLRRNGCTMLQLGLESGDQSVLDRMNKGISVTKACTILKFLKQAGIGTYIYLLFGTPHEEEASARRTLDLVATHSELIDFLNLAIFNLPIESSEANGLKVSQFSEGDLSLYVDFSHPQGWGRAQVRRFLDRDFRRHPAIAPIIRRDPPAFTSSHAPFFKSS